MAQNITLLGASYSDVPAVELPKTGGGTASFVDISDTTAVASDVASGKTFYASDGTKTTGTSSGGGGATNFCQTVDVVYDNKNGTQSMSIPISDTTKQNYVVTWAIIETGKYNNGVLTMDDTPTVPLNNNIPFSGTSTLLSTYQGFTGKVGSSSQSNVLYKAAQGVARGSVSTYAITIGSAISSGNITIRGQYSFGKSGYYLKYRCIVYGWNT